MDNLMTILFVAGILVGVIIFGVIARVAKRKSSSGKGEFDERQQIARGKAFTWAYVTLLVYLMLWIKLRSLEIPFFMESLSVILGALISVAVFAGYSIFHDAYFKASESPRTWVAIMCAIGLLNMCVGVIRLFRGETLAERLYQNMNLFVGMLLIVTLICVIIKRAMDRRSEAE